MNAAEQEKPQLHMVWPTPKRPCCPAISRAPGYTIRTFREGDEPAFLHLMSLSDFDPWDDEKLLDNINKIIPGGWFFAVDRTGQIVARQWASTTTPGYHLSRETSAGSSVTLTTGARV